MHFNIHDSVIHPTPTQLKHKQRQRKSTYKINKIKKTKKEQREIYREQLSKKERKSETNISAN